MSAQAAQNVRQLNLRVSSYTRVSPRRRVAMLHCLRQLDNPRRYRSGSNTTSLSFSVTATQSLPTLR